MDIDIDIDDIDIDILKDIYPIGLFLCKPLHVNTNNICFRKRTIFF